MTTESNTRTMETPHYYCEYYNVASGTYCGKDEYAVVEYTMKTGAQLSYTKSLCGVHTVTILNMKDVEVEYVS